MATSAQIKLIKIAQRELNIDDDTYRNRLAGLFRKRSSKDLTVDEATRLIKTFKHDGFKIRPKKNPQPENRKPLPENMVRMVSKQQWQKIYRLKDMIAWQTEDGMQRYFKNRLNLPKIRTSSDGFKAIEGLKGLFESQMKAAFGDDWAVLSYTDPDINDYIKRHKKVSK